MRIRIPALCIAFLVLTGLSACRKPPFHDSGIPDPEVWQATKDEALDAPVVVDDCAAVEQKWWSHFNDATLDTLIEIAIESNKNLAIAVTRIQEARAGRLGAWSLFFPQITLTGDASKGNQGFFTSGTIMAFKDAAVQATWEVDLFGKNVAIYNATDSLVQAAKIDRQAVVVGLLAEVARNYFDLRNYERQIAITEQNLASQQRTLELTREQMEGALASDFDVQRSAAQVSTTESRLPVLRTAYTMTANRLNVLLGASPGTYDELYKTEEVLEPLDPWIIVAAPATVLGTRPDVRAAERRFNANISFHLSAMREWFPDLSLLAFYGLQNMTLFNTIPTWNVVANLVQPLINFGRIQANIDATDAAQVRSFLEYQETVLEALENMENALSSYLNEIKRNLSLTNAAEQNRKAMELANIQYENGYTALLDVLVVQRNVLETESLKADSDALLRKDLVAIYTAAGGGWEYFSSECGGGM